MCVCSHRMITAMSLLNFDPKEVCLIQLTNIANPRKNTEKPNKIYRCVTCDMHVACMWHVTCM